MEVFMLLTIGMIVKNEEKLLEKCLNGIKPILDNVDSELIIADTGSTDSTVEIAQKFTDNVFYFEWIKDFAAARNSTLEKAHGEWYMFIDADEIFRSCDNIIHFFNSGEYKKYNSASFTIRNFMGEAPDSYVDFAGPRITKILPHTRFIGEIHESLNSYGAPFKKLNDIADHYGYLFNQDNDFDEKFKRNSEALLKKYEDEKDTNEMLYAQLYECFIGNDREKADRFLKEGIELCKKNNSIVLTVLYCDKMSTAFAEARYEDALETSEEYFGMSKAVRGHELTTDAEIYGLKASSLYHLNRYDEAIESYKKYFDDFKLIQSGKLNTYDMFLQTYTVATDRNFLPTLCGFVQCCQLAEKYNTAVSYLQSLPISKYIVNKGHVSYLALLEIDILEHFEFEGTYKLYKQFDEDGRKVFKALLRDRMYRYDKKEVIISALSELAKDDALLSRKIDIYKEYFSGSDIPYEQIQSFAEESSINDNADLFYISMDKGYDISPLFKCDNFDMKLCIYINYMSFYGFPAIAEKYNVGKISDIDSLPDVAKFYEYCMKMIPIYRCPKPNVFLKLSVEQLFESFAEIGRRYACESGKSEDELPDNIKAAVIAGDIIRFRREKKYRECFAAMKKAIIAYEGIAAVINEYQKSVVAEYEQTVNVSPTDEIQRLAVQIKKNIRRSIAAGDHSEALRILDEYKKINPYDPDIDVLYSKIGIQA